MRRRREGGREGGKEGGREKERGRILFLSLDDEGG